jgi:hypothetical protein
MPLFIFTDVKRRKIAVDYLALVLAYVSVAYALRRIELLEEMRRGVWTNLVGIDHC